MAQAGWTWIIYLAGDNNLEGAGVEDLREMQAVGSSDRLNVIVQFDTEVKGTTRYQVEKGALATIQKMPGVDTGDPKVLADFISWAIRTYPAKHYLVDIWNHGAGWENLPPGYNYEALRRTKPVRKAKLQRVKRAVFRTTAEQVLDGSGAKEPEGYTRAIAIDTGSHDYLDNQELKRAMTKGFGVNQQADILGCDACLMNMLEIAYEMRTTAKYMVGSEQTEPGAGWPYAAILKQLAAAPDMAPADLAKLIATEYGAWYHRHGSKGDGSATQSALDLGKVNLIATAVDVLAKALVAELPAIAGAVSLALAGTQSFEDYPEYVDLGSFATRLEQKLPASSKAQAAAAAVVKAVDSGGQFVIANATWGKAVNRATGISIYFPKSEQYSSDYEVLEMSKNLKWMPFLKAFYAAVKA